MKQDEKNSPLQASNAFTTCIETGETEAQAMGRIVLQPGLRHGQMVNAFAGPMFSAEGSVPSLTGTVEQLRKLMDQAAEGNVAGNARILAAQAAVLDNMFTDLCRRAFLNFNDYPEAAEKYIRLALKTQARCTATLEAISNIQRPTSEATRHVTVADGGQAIIADQFHHHAGVSQDGKADDQSHATAPACECSTLLCQDQGSERVSVTGSQGQEAVSDARRYKPRRTKG